MSFLKNIHNTTDFLSEIIFSNLQLKTSVTCRRGSKSWKQIVEDNDIWRLKFQDKKSWKYYNDNSETDS